MYAPNPYSSIPALVRSVVSGELSAIPPLLDELMAEAANGHPFRMEQYRMVLHGIEDVIQAIPAVTPTVDQVVLDPAALQLDKLPMPSGQLLSIPGNSHVQYHITDDGGEVDSINLIPNPRDYLKRRYNRFMRSLVETFWLDFHSLQDGLRALESNLSLEDRQRDVKTNLEKLS